MKNQSIVCFLLGFAPFFLGAQNNPQAHENESKFINLVESIVHEARAHKSSHSMVLYSKANFCGESLVLDGDWSANRNGNYWDDEIASIEVPPGMEVWLYEHPNFRGKTLVVSWDWSVRDNPWWRNRISSIRLVSSFDQECDPEPRRNRHGHGHRHGHQREHGVTVYEHSHFDGASKTIFDFWSKQNSEDFWDDRISSVDVPAGYVVILYKHPDFQGRTLTLKGPTSVKLDKDSWNDEVSSIEVFRR